MHLFRVEIEGYRSFRDPVTVEVDSRCTVILGANDHGKSNLLAALAHLNEDAGFQPDDLNWDCADAKGELPRVGYRLRLTDAEVSEVTEAVRRTMNQESAEKEATEAALAVANAERGLAEATSEVTEFVNLGARQIQDSGVVTPEVENDRVAAEERVTRASATLAAAQRHRATAELTRDTARRFAKQASIPDEVLIERKGLDGEALLVLTDEQKSLGDPYVDYILSKIPRVELIEAFRSVPDDVTYDQLISSDNDFMRGIFYYAGLQEAEWEHIFSQDEQTGMRLAVASENLNKSLRESWRQGSDLSFQLQHVSRDNKIVLWVRDPVVHSRYVRASQRSSGFTAFFALKTILHARQTESVASSYIWIFDEPGIFLHPDGQNDLMMTLETLASENQAVYTTHSLYMINKNHPTRHRLVMKGRRGTVIDGKPFTGQWRNAVDALGLVLPGTILFAPCILLVEGDSDPLLLYAVLQRLVDSEIIDLDLNQLGILSTGDSRHAEVLVRLLSSGATPPRMGALFDGDAGGADRLNAMKRLNETYGVAVHQLPRETTLEDHVLGASSLYTDAAIRFVTSISEVDPETIRRGMTDTIPSRGSRGVRGLAKWARESGSTVGKLTSPPSSVGVAREYQELLQRADLSSIKGVERKGAEEIAKWIQATLEVPRQTLTSDRIFRGES